MRTLLTDRAILFPAMGVVLAAFGWGIVEPLLPERLAKFGVTPSWVGLIFTISTIVYGLSAPLVAWVGGRVPVKRVIAFGAASMAGSLVLLGLVPDPILAAVALCLLNVSFAFTLNPTSAELGNAVDRLGLSCYAAVYAVYNIAYSIGMMATDTLALAGSEGAGLFRHAAVRGHGAPDLHAAIPAEGRGGGLRGAQHLVIWEKAGEVHEPNDRELQRIGHGPRTR